MPASDEPASDGPTSDAPVSPPPELLTGPADAEEAARRGQRDVAVQLHGARPEVHDWVAGEPGSYRVAIATLTAARSLGLHLTAHTRVVRSNARVLGELPRLLRARAVRRWILALPTGPLDTSVHPRLGLAVPSALSAMQKARALSVEAFLAGAPRCTMGRFAAQAWPTPPRAFAPRCDGCAAREECVGVREDYLARFGAGELRRVSTS